MRVARGETRVGTCPRVHLQACQRGEHAPLVSWDLDGPLEAHGTGTHQEKPPQHSHVCAAAALDGSVAAGGVADLIFVYAGGSSIVSGSSSAGGGWSDGPASSCWMMFTARKLGGTGDLRALVDGVDEPPARRKPPPYPVLSDVLVDKYDWRRSPLARGVPAARVPATEPSCVVDGAVGSGRTKGSGW